METKIMRDEEAVIEAVLVTMMIKRARCEFDNDAIILLKIALERYPLNKQLLDEFSKIESRDELTNEARRNDTFKLIMNDPFFRGMTEQPIQDYQLSPARRSFVSPLWFSIAASVLIVVLVGPFVKKPSTIKEYGLPMSKPHQDLGKTRGVSGIGDMLANAPPGLIRKSAILERVSRDTGERIIDPDLSSFNFQLSTITSTMIQVRLPPAYQLMKKIPERPATLFLYSSNVNGEKEELKLFIWRKNSRDEGSEERWQKVTFGDHYAYKNAFGFGLEITPARSEKETKKIFDLVSKNLITEKKELGLFDAGRTLVKPPHLP